MTDRDGSSSDDEVRLRELAEFLRERRARLDPEQLGLPARRRRRTPGLRREDVAERAAVSIAWYASLEQGRPVNPSKAVVSSLADALCLSDLDRAYRILSFFVLGAVLLGVSFVYTRKLAQQKGNS